MHYVKSAAAAADEEDEVFEVGTSQCVCGEILQSGRP